MAKSIDFLLFQEENQKNSVDSGDHVKESYSEGKRSSIFPFSFLDACHAASSFRGIGYKYGIGVHIPKDSRPMQRWSFLRATLRQLVSSFLILDCCDSLYKLLPAFTQNPSGTSIYLDSLPQPKRTMVAFLITFPTAFVIREIFLVVYLSLTIFGVLILNNPPSAWPPFFDEPFRSDSLHYYWAKGWHQLLRRTFVVCGGRPGMWLSRKLGLPKGIGLVLGTFAVCAICHEYPFYTLGDGLDWRTPAFFFLCGCGVVGEKAWKKVTGYTVRGPLGWMWVFVFAMTIGQMIADSFHRRGLGSSVIIPPALSPMRQLFFPSIQASLQKWLPGLVSWTRSFISDIK